MVRPDGVIASSSERVNADGTIHVYRSWSLEGGYHIPIHSEAVINREIDEFIAEHKVELTIAQRNLWVWDINVISDNKKVTCDYCLEWIHA